MKYTVLGISTINEAKAEAGVKVMFGDAEFTILPISECKEFKAAGVAQSFAFADEIVKLKKEKEAARNKKPLDIEEIERVALREAEIEEEQSMRTAPLLIKGWNISEKSGKISASLISRLALAKPDAVTGEVGNRVAKFSREAAAALCADRELRVSLANKENGNEVPARFHDWIGIAAGDDVRLAVYDEIPAEKFGPLAGK